MNARGERGAGFGGIFERGEIWESVESEDDASDDAFRAVILHFREETRSEMHRIEQIEECALGIGPGDYGAGGDFFTIREDDADNGAIFDVDACDFGAGANFGAGLFGRGRQSVGRGVHSARAVG